MEPEKVGHKTRRDVLEHPFALFLDDVSQILGYIAASVFYVGMIELAIIVATKKGCFWQLGYLFLPLFTLGAVAALISASGETVSVLLRHGYVRSSRWLPVFLIFTVVLIWGAAILFTAISFVLEEFLK